ncbi:hypothetical protein V3481_007669 [Fusarium oxysporum f. sp. vasinfectum]
MAMKMEPCFGPLYQSYLCCSLRIPRQHLTRNNSEIRSLQIPRVSTVQEYLAAAHGASIQSVPSGQDASFEELSALKAQKPFPLHAFSLSLFSVAIRKALIDSDE